ncbi:hypothetical protein Csa_007480 [Cucumis sativus]|nr:hypothetical protein Csa_007480 [Cucumis sativus]
MLSRIDSKKIGSRSGSEKLLNEIETINKALYLNKHLSKNSNPVANNRQRYTVHLIEGLPSDLDDFSLSVFWKRRDGLLVTNPKKIIRGKVEFEEVLNCTCTVHGSGNGPHHSAKYEAKHFLLYASLYGASEVDLGKHRVDLTRFLPLTLEELEEEKSSGKWATSFKLSGRAKGATMNVSFGYTVVGDNLPALEIISVIP